MIKSPKGTWELCTLVPNICWEALFLRLARIPFEKKTFQNLAKWIEESVFKGKSIKFPYINAPLADIGYKKIKHLSVPEISCMPSPNHWNWRWTRCASVLLPHSYGNVLWCFFCSFLQSSSKLPVKLSPVQSRRAIMHIDSLADSVWWDFFPTVLKIER